MNDITKKILEELVINFISEMNEWEKYCNEFDEDQLELDETEHKIKQMVASIISKYCTDKERKMSRPNALSWGLEGSYDYVENPLKVVPLIHSNLTPVKFSHSPFCLFLFSSYSSCPLCRVLH